jgi:hypothetical protein
MKNENAETLPENFLDELNHHPTDSEDRPGAKVPIVAKSESFEVVVKQFLAANENCGEPEYVSSLRYRLRKFVRTLGKLPIGSITRPQLNAIIGGRRRTMLMEGSVIETFFDWSRSRGFLPLDQPTAADQLRVQFTPSKPRLLATPLEIKKLLVHSPDMQKTLWIVFSVFAGLGDFELDALRWEWIKPGEGIQIPQCCQGVRVILPVLDAWIRPFYGSQGKVFSSGANRYTVRDFARRINVRLCQNLWHCYCVYRLADPINLRQTAREKGYDDPRYFGRFFFHPVTLAEAQHFFSLTPEAVGITAWPEKVA